MARLSELEGLATSHRLLPALPPCQLTPVWRTRFSVRHWLCELRHGPAGRAIDALAARRSSDAVPLPDPMAAHLPIDVFATTAAPRLARVVPRPLQKVWGPVAARNRVNLAWWDRRRTIPHYTDPRGNVGDMLSPVITELVARSQGVSLSSPTTSTRHLAAIGSLIGSPLLTHDSCVWGTGFQPSYARSQSPRCFRHLDIRAVRGPLTARFLHDKGVLSDPERIPFGDPAVLLPLFHTSGPVAGNREPLVLLHESDDTIAVRSSSARTMSVLAVDWRPLVDAVASASIVVSTSLHGIILAEAYGVPAVMVDSPKVSARFKFEDWYLSTGRTEHPVARTVSEALTLSPAPVPDLAAMQQRLLEAFPVDLWDAPLP